MVYEWKSGTRIKANAQESGELFEKLSATEEGLTAETLEITLDTAGASRILVDAGTAKVVIAAAKTN